MFTDLATAAAVASSMLALFAVIAAVVKAIRFLAHLPQDLKSHFFRPRYILLATPEELARYSAKEAWAEREATLGERREELQSRVIDLHVRRVAKSMARLEMIFFASACIYTVFLARIVFFAMPALSEVPFILFALYSIIFVGSVSIVISLEAVRQGFSYLMKRYWISEGDSGVIEIRITKRGRKGRMPSSLPSKWR